jgi:pimeloyl-ACP methyl ester carboxylesterase
MTRFFKEHQKNALNSNHPSELTLQYLRLQNMADLYKDDRAEFFVQFSDHVLETRTLQAARALAELSLLDGRKQLSRDKLYNAIGSYLTAAETSYRYLLNMDSPTVDAAMNPEYRFITQIYNAAVAELVEVYGKNLTQKETYQTNHTSYDYALAEPSHELWHPDAFDELISAYEIKTKGLRNKYFQPGMGAAMIGIVETPSEKKVHWGGFFAGQKAAYPVTVMLLFDAPRMEGTKRYVNTQGVFYNPLTLDHVILQGQKVPLETDYSSPLVMQLNHLDPSSMGLSAMFHSDKNIDDAGLFLLEPYNPDKIPVLMVHGLMSTPETWVNMFNDLRGCPEIRDRFQFWFFSYPTGLPVLYSSSILRQKLLEVQAQLDPDKSNPNFNNAVLIGHSMGGLLSRVMMQEPGNIYYDKYFSEPIDQLSISESTRELLEEALFFEPIPFFKRVIFVAAPHRGAPMADKWYSKFANDMINLPGNLANATTSLVSDTDSLNQEILKDHKKIRTQSISNLSKTSPFSIAYNKVPVRSDLPYHSIIGIGDFETGPGSTDGVVPYESSHVDFAVSERLVHSDHQAPRYPDAIDEVKRILLLHLEETEIGDQ